MTLGELLVAWGGLGLLGLLVFLPHILHGGLYLDDWADAAATLHPPGDSGLLPAFSYFNELLSSCRPVLIVFIPLKYLLFGTHIKLLLTLSIGLAILAAALMYAVLRVLSVPWYHAWVISALTIVYPWFDSTRFWESANPITLAIVFAFAGLWMALVGLSRDSWRLHGGAALLYLLSMLTYEVTLPFIAMAGVLYCARSGWRAARFRWGTDLVMVVIAGLWDRAHTPKAVSSLSGDLSHLKQIVSHGGELLARTLFPVGVNPHTSMMLTGLAAIFAVGLSVYFLLPGARPPRSAGGGLRGWLLLGVGGLVVTALGWVIFTPADPYYTPSIFGVTNRVNGLAGFGLVLIVYAALGVVGLLVGQLVKGRTWVAAATTLTLALMLGAAYVHVLERHGRLWREAYSYELTAVERVHGTFPRLPHGTTVFAGNYPTNVTLGVTIFAATWDLDGMVKLTYADPTLRAYPITEEVGLECLANGVRVGGEEGGITIARYGTARLIDLQTGKSSRPVSRRECLARQPEYAPGPLYLATAY
jgi:hypothetical protein